MSARNELLESAIVDEPESADAYLVYGDWLLEQGDALGELVSLQARIAKLEARAGNAKAKKELRAREKLLLKDAEQRLGQLKTYEHSWSFGFLESLVLENPSVTDYEAVLGAPAARFLRELDIEGLRRFSLTVAATHPTIAMLARLGVPPTTRKLALRTEDSARIELGTIPPDFWAKLASVRELMITAGPIRTGAISLPNLETLLLNTPLTDDLRAALEAAHLPRLKSIQIDTHIGLSASRIRALLERWVADGTVRHVGMTEHNDGNAMLSAIVASGLVPQLTSLDLSRTELSDVGGHLVLENASLFEHLESLNVSQNDLSPATCRALEARFDLIVDIEEQGIPEDDDSGSVID